MPGHILKDLKQFGLNPKDWTIQKYQHRDGKSFVWFQSLADKNFLLMGALECSVLSNLELMSI